MTPAGTRFAFGKNWSSFLKEVDAARVEQAVTSLRELLKLDAAQPQPLKRKTFLDIGSGSGLFSLAAVSLGAAVVSIDIDRESVECTRRLKEQFEDSLKMPENNSNIPAIDPSAWQIHRVSVLDGDAMSELGSFDIVYSWGVLHHTGDMVAAIDAASQHVATDGWLAIAIYNDQGGPSRRWLAIKRGYHALPTCLRSVYVAAIASLHEFKFALARVARGRSPLPLADWRAKRADRGMSVWHDWVDWIGGLPFEVAAPEAIILPLRRHGFVLENLRTLRSGWGCNEYVFRRQRERPSDEAGS